MWYWRQIILTLVLMYGFFFFFLILCEPDHTLAIQKQKDLC